MGLIINIIGMSNHDLQQLSPTVLQAQKAVADQKQGVTIRKVTIEAIAPVIAKVEEHIAYLVEETTSLRRENANLRTAQANQRMLQEQIATINATLQQLTNDITVFNRDKESKLIDHSNELMQFNDMIVKLRQDGVARNFRIDEISGRSQSYLEQIQLNKKDQLEAIETLKTSLQNYYDQEMVRVNGLSDDVSNLRHNVRSLQEYREKDQQQAVKMSNILVLYENERQDLKKVIEKTAFLDNNVVMLSDYNENKKFTKVEMEMVKEDVRRTVDEALTPQIRTFLPKLISKLDDLQQFSNKLTEIYQGLDRLKNEHGNLITNMKQEWNDRFTNSTTSNVKQFNEVRVKIDKNISQMNKQIEKSELQLRQQLKNINQDIVINKEEAQRNIKMQTEAVQSKIKNYINIWGNTFIEQKKTQIYALIQQCKPHDQAQQEKKAFQMINSIEPLLQSVKEQIQSSRQQLDKTKKYNEEKLSSFSNQMVKLRSDLNIETKENKKALESFNKKLKSNDQTNKELSKLISKLVESTILTYSLSIDQGYLQRQQEVFVTYNDGILMEVNQGDTLKYRRKQLNPQLIKRAVLGQFVKLIDGVVMEQPNIGWGQSEMKPSHFFSSIYYTYIAMFQQNAKSLKLVAMAEKRGQSQQKSPRSSRFKSTQLNMPKINSNRQKIASQHENMSKTIDFQSSDLKDPTLRPRYQKDGQPYSSNRKSIRLKKIDK